MLTIYHNTRCGKSRCALQTLEGLGQPFEIVEYLKSPPTVETIRHLLVLLGKKPLEVIRTTEPLFQEQFAGKTRSDDEWIAVIAAHPILLERPIVVAGDRAWVARDDATLEAIQSFLKPV